MTYIDYLNSFNKWLETNMLSKNAQLMYFKLLHVFNAAGWPEKVSLSTEKLMVLICTSDKRTAYKARDELIEAGFLIEAEPGVRGRASTYMLQLPSIIRLQFATVFCTENPTELCTEIPTESEDSKIRLQKPTETCTENPTESCSSEMVLQFATESCTDLPTESCLEDKMMLQKPTESCTESIPVLENKDKYKEKNKDKKEEKNIKLKETEDRENNNNNNNISSRLIFSNFVKLGFSDKLVDTVKNWIIYKKERRQTYQPTGLKQLLDKIHENVNKYGEDKVIEIIQITMASNYNGIIWDKLETKKSDEPYKYPTYTPEELEAMGSL